MVKVHLKLMHCEDASSLATLAAKIEENNVLLKDIKEILVAIRQSRFEIPK